MAICKDCGQEMRDADTCTFTHLIDKNENIYKRYTEHFSEPNGRCGDCGIKHGGVHHYGCDVERCPKCGLQLISCGCDLVPTKDVPGQRTAVVRAKDLGVNCWLSARQIPGTRCERVRNCNYPEKKGCPAVDAEIAYLDKRKETTNTAIENMKKQLKGEI